ncbi:hypothetical protein [Methanocalculus sp. MSAO_Arc2]|uniref:hypothetical protein n=1 Tax=Methanocalculus sp. MSAO_Arc2 TaxID=2293855 RepID=UPI00267D3D69
MSWPNSAYDPDCPGDDRPNDDSPGDYPGDYHPDKDYPGDGISWKSRQATHPSQSGAPTHPSQPGELKHHLKPGQPHYIPVSTIVRSSVCPVRVYLERFEPIEEPFQYTVAKQVGYHLGGGAHLKSDAGWNHHTGADLDARSIWEEIRLVRPDINDEMFSYLEACVAACRGIDQNPHWDPPVAIDVACKHKKYAISGRIDWLFDSHPEIGILRATRAPTHGVWKQDRIRAAAYLLAAEELEMPGPPGVSGTSGVPGFFRLSARPGLSGRPGTGISTRSSEVRIVYIPSGTVRRVAPTASDRRSLLSALKKVEAIYRGETPRAPPDAPCERCPKKETCIREPPTLLERFFRRN